MKRIISAVSLILLLVAVFATPADASTGFTLTDGVVEGCLNEEGCMSLRINGFWNNIRIDVGGASSFAAEALCYARQPTRAIDGLFEKNCGRCVA